MNEQPTPYTPPRQRSRVTFVHGAPVAPVTLSPLIDGMVTGTLGKIPLTSIVYEQIEMGACDHPLAWVWFNGYEVLGLSNENVIRCRYNNHPLGLPQLILTDGAR